MKKSGRKEISEIKLIVFPGNPGLQYSRTRHNISWLLLDTINPVSDWQKKFKGLYCRSIELDNSILLKPETFMNKTGESVRAASDFTNLILKTFCMP